MPYMHFGKLKPLSRAEVIQTRVLGLSFNIDLILYPEIDGIMKYVGYHFYKITIERYAGSITYPIIIF